MPVEKGKNVAVVVLGDIGRSPRMQYHAESLSNCDFNVDIIGYGDTKPLDSLVNNSNVNIIHLPPFPSFTLPKLLTYVLKTLWQSLCLLFILLYKRKSDYILCQNPPAIPTLYICWFYALVVRAKLIIDWHNYAHTIMALQLGREHKLVQLASFIESRFGRLADGHLCVTKAMKFDLKKTWKIRATTLYDRPQESFKPITLEDKHELFERLAEEYPIFQSEDKTNKFTHIVDGEVQLKNDRPGLLISSTSWTEDEDFEILLNVFKDYDNAEKEHNLPQLICIITGKGPLKEFYIERIKNLELKNILVLTPWLEAEDYPKLLASADLGVCLHTSSSGLDLPMKVVDMFGCGLPVCAFKFKCINELVKHERNGYTFTNYIQLKDQIFDWFRNFPNNLEENEKQNRIRNNIKEFQELGWSENWNVNAYPYFK